MSNIAHHVYAQILRWHIDMGADEAISDTPVDATSVPSLAEMLQKSDDILTPQVTSLTSLPDPNVKTLPASSQAALKDLTALVQAASSLDDLRNALLKFDGLPIQKTASNLVFADGHADAPLMFIGDVPSDEDDRMGQAFTGDAGLLLDKILTAIGYARFSENIDKTAYITPLFHWRLPGNRSPHATEIEAMRIIMQRQIELKKPKLIVMLGALPAQAMLGTNDKMRKLQGQWFSYKDIPTIVTYQPSYLLLNPLYKRQVWADMLKLLEKINNM
jgi:uracil-DNA glycosylase family 4